MRNCRKVEPLIRKHLVAQLHKTLLYICKTSRETWLSREREGAIGGDWDFWEHLGKVRWPIATQDMWLNKALKSIAEYLELLSQKSSRAEMVAAIARSLHEDMPNILAMEAMPPVRRERRPKMGLVERRAAHVEEKVREWRRKLSLAETRLAHWEMKQRYYQKKLQEKEVTR